MKHQENTIVEALQSFAKQFGDDSEYSRIVMEILLEEIMASEKNYNKQNGSINGCND